MKISDLIKESINLAEAKFELTDHLNDAIHVTLSNHTDLCDTSFRRPTKDQLNKGEIIDVSTVKISEFEKGFHTEGYDLLTVLQEMHNKVDAVDIFNWLY